MILPLERLRKTLACAKQLALLLCLLATSQSHAEQLFNGALYYTPPIPMLGGDQAGNAGLPISGWEFRTESALLTWSPAGENRWKRSDGARAALHANSLVVASAEMWLKIRFDDVKK
jgi:hypothetical protein